MKGVIVTKVYECIKIVTTQIEVYGCWHDFIFEHKNIVI